MKASLFRNIKISLPYLILFVLAFSYVTFNTGAIFVVIRLSVLTILSLATFFIVALLRPKYVNETFGMSLKPVENRPFFEVTFNIFLFIFVLYTIISLIWSRAPNYGFDKIYYLLFRISIFIVFAKIVYKYPSWFLQANYFSLLIAFGLFLMLVGSPASGIDNLLNAGVTRLGNSDGNPLSFGRYMGFGIIVSTYYLRDIKPGRYSKLIKLFVCGSIGYATVYLLLSGSRGPMIGLVVSLIAVYLLEALKRQQFKKIFKIIFIVAFLVVCVVSLYNMLLQSSYTGLVNYLTFRFSPEHSTGSFDARMGSISLALNSINTPGEQLFGAGYGDFGYLKFGRDTRIYPHNIFVEIYYELGMVGILSFVGMLLIIGMKAVFSKLDNFSYFLLTCLLFFLLNANATSDVSGNYMLFAYGFLFCGYSVHKNSFTNSIN